jgi:hypothetical protein
VRRALASHLALAREGEGIDHYDANKSHRKPLISAVMRLVARGKTETSIQNSVELISDNALAQIQGMATRWGIGGDRGRVKPAALMRRSCKLIE